MIRIDSSWKGERMKHNYQAELERAVEQYKATAACASRVELGVYVPKGKTLYIRAPRVLDRREVR